MSAFDDWLAAKGKSRDAADALDEILWLRTERQRLRLTDAEREAVKEGIYLCEGAAGEANENINFDAWAKTAGVLRGLLERLAPIAACDTTPAPQSTPGEGT